MKTKKNFFKQIFNYFMQGMVVLAPIFITIYIGFIIFKNIDISVRDLLGLNIPGLGIIILFVFITFLGILTKTFIFAPIGKLVEKIVTRTPFVKIVYSAIKDLAKAFAGEEKKFDRPVLVLVNTISNLEKIGFLTQEDLNDLGIKDKVAVYFPHSYNFSGELFIVPSGQVKPLDISPSEAMKFIVTGGVAKY